MPAQDCIRWFDDLDRSSMSEAGSKGASLGELTSAGLPVPEGFVVTADGYLQAMEDAGIRTRLLATFTDARNHVSDPAALAASSVELRRLVREAGVPATIASQVRDAYRGLGEDTPVAVRSSVTAEDASGTSSAGMHAGYAGVIGADEVLDRVADCWASLYGQHAIALRARDGIVDEPTIAVVVQRQVAAERSGVLFTTDPMTADCNRIVIEGAFGLGQVVIGGTVEPDTYVLTKAPAGVERVRIGHKDHELVTREGSVRRVDLCADDADRRVLTDEEAVALGRLGLEVEAHYGAPQDIEWAIDADGTMFLLRSRPITTWWVDATPDADHAPDVAMSGAASG